MISQMSPHRFRVSEHFRGVDVVTVDDNCGGRYPLADILIFVFAQDVCIPIDRLHRRIAEGDDQLAEQCAKRTASSA